MLVGQKLLKEVLVSQRVASDINFDTLIIRTCTIRKYLNLNIEWKLVTAV